MGFRVVAAAFVLVAATATARAQAPGDYSSPPPSDAPAPAYATPAYGPSTAPGMVLPVYVPPPHESVMAHRLAVGISLGHLSLSSKDNPDQKTEFGVGEIAIRLRATLHLEVELALGGGQEQLPDGSQGRDLHSAALGARYRFSPEDKWNWWLGAGIGMVSIVDKGATDQMQQSAQRSMLRLGLGLERRWHHFALQAELHAVALGPQKGDSTVQPGGPPVMPTGGTAPPTQSTPVPGAPTVQPPTPTTQPPSDKLSGAEFTIGASYYF